MINESVYKELIEKYTAHFGHAPDTVAYAPGRIEVLGNHTDYNEGFVFSAAINHGTFFAVSKATSSTCRLVAGDLMKEVTFDITRIEPSTTDTWQNYVKGTLAGVLAAAGTDITCGCDAMFLGNIPLGSGLSSSAALEMCTGLACAKLYGVTIAPVEMAKIGQQAEHVYAGCKCGLLDQISSLAGQEGKLVKTDFRSIQYETVDMGPDACFLMCVTHAKHALVDGEYTARRAACEQAAEHFANVLHHPVRALRDVSMSEWLVHKKGLPKLVANRAAHPIGEDERVLKGAEMLKSGDLQGFGAMMFDSHLSSRYYFENSCVELDATVDAAEKIPGVLGARLSGGGFGGSVVVLVNPRDAEVVSTAIANAYQARFGEPCDVSVIKPSAGACIIQ